MIKSFLRPLLVCGALFVAQAAAYAQSVLIINGSSGTSEPGTTAAITTNLAALHAAAGNSVTIVSDIPVDISGFAQVWDIRFDNAFALDLTQQAQYLAYLQGGGGMFLMGENDSFMARNNSIFSLIGAAGGGSIGFGFGSNTQTVLAPFTGPNAVTTVDYAAAGFFDGKGTGQWITQSGLTGSGIAFARGALTNATNGTLTTILDVNFMQNVFDLPASQNLTKNLIGFVGSQVSPTPVPEPSTYGLVGAVALVGVAIYRRRRAT